MCISCERGAREDSRKLEDDPEDAMIAGIAKVHGEAVITRNVRHFVNIERVEIEKY